MGSTAAAGWSRQREDAAAQCDSLCSTASTVSSLSMFLCDGRDSSVSSAATPAGASFSWQCAQHGDIFGGKLNGLQSRAGQQRNHPYGKAVMEHGCTPCAYTPCANLALASAPPLPSTLHGVVIFNNREASTSFGQKFSRTELFSEK